jgi:protein-S-isoprenylcysteine O-methyltransferase Ste14
LRHSVFARPAFKRWWTQFVPQPIERSTYVLVSTLLLAAAMAFWQPLPQAVWHVGHPLWHSLAWAMFAIGFGLVLYSTFMIDHFELFGVRQIVLYLLNKNDDEPRFVTPVIYRVVRHPLMFGWLITFWSTPTMSVGHLLFTLINTGYIFIGIALEERTLSKVHGEPYVAWKKRTPMLLPWLKLRSKRPAAKSPAARTAVAAKSR